MTNFVPVPVLRFFTSLFLMLGMTWPALTQEADTTDRPARISTEPAVKNEGATSLRMLAQVDNQPQPQPETPPAKPPAPGTGGGRGGPGGRSGGRSGGTAGSSDTETVKIEGDKVSLLFPNNSITDILGIYERLTGKALVKDSSIFEGQAISLVTPSPVEKAEAIKLIESSLLTNGYAIVAAPDGKSARILPMRSRDAAGVQFSQGVKFYQSAADLPQTETLVSYFLKLDHLDPAQAAQMLGNHVGLNVYGRITPVSAPPGLLITESATIVRQLVSISEVIDSADSAKSLVTKFVPLKYADAPTVAQIIQATLDAQAQDKEQRGVNTIRGSAAYSQRSSQGGGGGGGSGGGSAPAPAEAPQPSIGNLSSSNNLAVKKPQAKSQVVADSRLNQLLVVAEPDDYTYVMSLIAEFDKPVDVPEAYERKLKNIYSVDVLSVLADLLKDPAKGTTQLPGGGTLNANNQQLVSSNNSLVTGRSTSTNQRGGTISRSGSTTGGSTSGDATGSTIASSIPDQLIEAQQDNSPISVLVNKTRVIADPLANSIIVIGPKEDKDKVNMLLDKLDQKSPSAYLATVIGELTLDNGMNTGVDYLQHFKSTGTNKGYSSSNINGRGDVITNNNITDVRNHDITAPFGPLTGFNMYGQISEALDVFVSALETNNKFKVLSRPSVFALNNKKAVITSGQSIPVPTQTLNNASSSGTNSNGNVTTTIAYKDVVLKLEVIPLIDPDGMVTLKIAQTNDTVIGNQVVALNAVPIIGTEQLTTTVTVPSGNTVVLGGLISETEKKDTSGIPYISRLPLLGALFRNKNTSKERKELIIFIQPTVVKDIASMRRASLAEDIRTQVGADTNEKFPEKVIPVAKPVDPVKKEPEKKKSFWDNFRRKDKTETPAATKR